MKLVIQDLSPWPVHFMGSGTYDPRTEISIIITPLDERIQPRAFRQRVLGISLPAFANHEVVAERSGVSRLEWPVEIVESRVLVANDAVEARLSVLYSMLEWSAAVILRGRPARVAAERDRALTVLLSGRPDWSRPEIVAIAQLRGLP